MTGRNLSYSARAVSYTCLPRARQPHKHGANLCLTDLLQPWGPSRARIRAAAHRGSSRLRIKSPFGEVSRRLSAKHHGAFLRVAHLLTLAPSAGDSKVTRSLCSPPKAVRRDSWLPPEVTTT